MKHLTVPSVDAGAMSWSQTAVSAQRPWLKAEQPEVQPCFVRSCVQDLLWEHRSHPSLSLVCTLSCPSAKALLCFPWHWLHDAGASLVSSLVSCCS